MQPAAYRLRRDDAGRVEDATHATVRHQVDVTEVDVRHVERHLSPETVPIMPVIVIDCNNNNNLYSHMVTVAHNTKNK